MKYPDGSPAEGVPINIRMLEQQKSSTTNQEGAAFDVFNLPSTDEITVEVCISLDIVQTYHTALLAKPEVLKVGTVMVDLE